MNNINNITETEFKALKWAALYLIPEEELNKALKTNLNQKELAQLFNVTEAMLRFRLKLMNS